MKYLPVKLTQYITSDNGSTPLYTGWNLYGSEWNPRCDWIFYLLVQLMFIGAFIRSNVDVIILYNGNCYRMLGLLPLTRKCPTEWNAVCNTVNYMAFGICTRCVRFVSILGIPFLSHWMRFVTRDLTCGQMYRIFHSWPNIHTKIEIHLHCQINKDSFYRFNNSTQKRFHVMFLGSKLFRFPFQWINRRIMTQIQQFKLEFGLNFLVPKHHSARYQKLSHPTTKTIHENFMMRIIILCVKLQELRLHEMHLMCCEMGNAIHSCTISPCLECAHNVEQELKLY